jgi:hypothetical protein
VFLIKDLSPYSMFLRVQLIQDRKNQTIHLTQERYAEKVLYAFRLQDAKLVFTPMEVGALKQMFLYNSKATIMEITHY